MRVWEKFCMMRTQGSTLDYDLLYWLPNLFLSAEPFHLSPCYLLLIMLCCLQTEESDGRMRGLKPFYIRKCWQNRQYSAWRSKKRAVSFILAAQKSPWFFFLVSLPILHYLIAALHTANYLLLFDSIFPRFPQWYTILVFYLLSSPFSVSLLVNSLPLATVFGQSSVPSLCSLFFFLWSTCITHIRTNGSSVHKSKPDHIAKVKFHLCNCLRDACIWKSYNHLKTHALSYLP